jgi:aromatic-L-amino-acid decarboxylase
MNHDELAETGRLQELLSAVGSGLDEYLKFHQPDALVSQAHWKAHLNQPLPVAGAGIDTVVDELVSEIIPYGSPVPRPGFCGYITTGATTVSALAAMAAQIASPQRYLLTAFNEIEEISLQWLAQLCGVAHLKGVYSTGGSVANLIALGGARQVAFERVGIDPAQDGIDRPARVYASAECHHTIQRSCGVLGLGRNAVVAIACDETGRMRIDALRAAIQHDQQQGLLAVAIVANAGTTNTGAIDPLDEVADIAAENDIWFHVDGAYGLPGILDERIAPLYRGLERADSVIVDPHKWLGASVGIGATFVRDREVLRRAFTQGEADYLEGTVEALGQGADIEHSMDSFGIPYFDYGVELSSPSRGVVVWAMLKEVGVEGFRQRICRHIDMARYVADFTRQNDNLELLLEPTLSVCCFRYVAEGVEDLDALNQQIFRQLVRENEVLPSTTRVNGKLALRPCWIGARSKMEHAEALVRAVLRIGGELV